jgi:hypothetical protein
MHMFQNRLPEIHAKIRAAALAVDTEHWGICAAAVGASNGGALSTRCIELHSAGPSGGLPHARHFDSGSCVTIDIMLREPIAGGTFCTLEHAGADAEPWDQEYEFRVGDAVVFPSHK